MHSAPLTIPAKSQAAFNTVSIADALGAPRGQLRRYAPVPELADRAYWTPILVSAQEHLIAAGKKCLQINWPDLPLTLYRDFNQSDNRTRFEAIYYNRRQRLNDLVLAELADAQGRFVTEIAKGIDVLCTETGWQLPAHNRYVRGGPILPLPDPARPVVDLFAAQTASQLSTVVALLGEALPKNTIDKVHTSVRQRVLDPYLNHPFWWTGRLGGRMNNWTTWCTSSVLHVAFQSDRLDADYLDAIAQSAARSLDEFLEDYGDDGACPEGPNYYRHAALCLFAALDCLNGASGGRLDAVLTSQKLRNMAEFPLFMHLAADRFANFGDGDSRIRGASAGMFAAGKLCGSQELCAFAAAQEAAYPSETAPYDFCLCNRLRELCFAQELLESVPAHAPTKNGFLPSIGLLVARCGETALAIKAGPNLDSHNHNDSGSLIVHHGETPVLIDVGVENYTRKTFSDARFDIWTMQSGFHNVADFCGAEQRAGDEFVATDLSWSLETDSACFSAELAGTYGPEAQLTSYRREMVLAGDGTITLQDTYKGARSATLTLMTCLAPTIAGDQILLGEVATIACKTATQATFETIPISDSRLRQSWPEKLFRLRIPFDGHALRVVISEYSADRQTQNA
ncbi:MAG: heparinase II/III family protein [Hyphomicrobiales bacterium]